MRRPVSSRTRSAGTQKGATVSGFNISTVSSGWSKSVSRSNCSLELNGIGGIDDRYDLVAANAVDLVVSQLNGNESGVPAIPRMLLFPGGWVEGKRSASR